ncbi:amino acid permease [Nocardia donostiensis]|uniref:APC family permease n=1 Tax=Nocardia donostiensis TaxID=1538463 RepID=UPI0009DB1AB7|nr:amino acid permease [Nocardia donostiensis]OQS13389.1 amino acid permease [Nocardia donostiensis]
MSDIKGPPPATSADDAHLRVLGYEEQFDRKINLWSNFALGFLYLSPLVGVIALFAQGLSTGGPPSIWWIAIVAAGQLLVALVFGEIVSQFPISGGLYQWARRLWNGRYAWGLTWIYIAGVIIGITTTAMFSADFVAALIFGSASDPGASSTPGERLIIALVVVAIALALNATGSKTLATIAKIGLAAELAGVIAVGLFLLLFRRQNSVSVLFDTMGTGHGSGYPTAFLAASLTGLLLFYGFEACGEVAEETPNPGRTIPRSMALTVVVGGASAFLAYAGYILAAPNLPEIVTGKATNPVPEILQNSLGTVGTKAFLVVALTSFLACVMGQQAAASRLIFSFARDGMFPGSTLFSRVTRWAKVPLTSLLAVNVIPIGLFVFLYFVPDALFRVAAFQMLAGYVAFQMVVLASIRARARGWIPAGRWSLGRWGWPVSVAALTYGIFSIVLLAKPAADTQLAFYDRWVALIGFLIVAAVGVCYMWFAKPYRHSAAPEGDAIEIANRLRELRTTAAREHPSTDDDQYDIEIERTLNA